MDIRGGRNRVAALFGWEYEGNSMDDGQVYVMAQINGSDVGAMYSQQKVEAEMGLPPYWRVYITVDDVEAVAARVPKLGAKLMMEPFDAFGAGRMCIVQDPTGAVVPLWQTKTHIGCKLRDEHGALTWAELLTPDQESASKFYAELLEVGLDTASMPMPEGENYHMLTTEDGPVAGVMTLPDRLIEMSVPPHWEIYFRVNDVNNMVEIATSLGAQMMFGPEVLPMVGTIGVLQDPQGAVFGIQQPSAG